MAVSDVTIIELGEAFNGATLTGTLYDDAGNPVASGDFSFTVTGEPEAGTFEVTHTTPDEHVGLIRVTANGSTYAIGIPVNNYVPSRLDAVPGELAAELSARGLTLSWAEDVDEMATSAATNAGAAATLAASTNTRVLLSLPAYAPNVTNGLLVVGGTGLSTTFNVTPLSVGIVGSTTYLYGCEEVRVGILQGADRSFPFGVRNIETGEPETFADDAEFRFVVWYVSDRSELFTVEGGAITESDGTVTVTVSHEDTADVEPGSYRYDLWLVGGRTPLARGQFDVGEAVFGGA